MNTLSLAVVSACLLSTPAADAQRIEKNGMSVSWTVEDRHLHVRLSAPTTGWVLVGFNDRPGLQGAKLLFFRVRAGVAEGEVHRTDLQRYPAPYHRSRMSIGGSNYVTAVEGTEHDGTTTVQGRIPLDSGEPLDVRLASGRKVHMILAYSVSDDFDHHSRMRTSADIVL